MKTHGEHTMPRGQWMATDGRELYHEWLSDLIARHSEQDEIYDENNFRMSHSNGWDDLAENEIVETNLQLFYKQFGGKLVARSDPAKTEDMALLMGGANAIKHYTSADDMLGESSNWPRAIEEHSRDSVQFASRVSLGLAYDAYQASGYAVINSADLYDKLSEIMGDQSFHKVLEAFSRTGFAVLADKSRNAMLREDTPFLVSHKLGLGLAPVRRIVQVDRGENGAPTYRLNPRIEEKLIERLCDQNKARSLKNVGSYVLHQRVKERSFTTGCPVRKAPASELEKGNQKSGIALLSEYMGDELARVVGGRFRAQRALAGAALDTL